MTGLKPSRAAHAVSIFRRHARLFVGVLALVAILCAATYHILPKFYVTNVRLIAGNANSSGPKIAASDDTSLPLLDVMLQLRGEQTADTLATLVRETSVADRVISDLGLHVDVKRLLSSVDASPVVNTTILEIRVKWTDPATSAAIGNAYAHAFVEQERAFVAGGAANIVTFLEAEIPSARERMRRSRTVLDAYSARSGIVDVTHQTQAKIDAATDVAERSAKLQIDIRQALAEDGALAVAQRSIPRTTVDSREDAPNPLAQSLRDDSAKLDIDIRSALQRYTKDHPTVRALEAQKAAVDRQIAKQPSTIVASTRVVPNPLASSIDQQRTALRARLDGDRAQIAELAAQENQLNDAVRTLPVRTSEFAELSRDAKLAEDVYTSLQHKLADALILKTTAYSDLAITQPARADFATQVPDRKVSLLVSLLVSLVAAAGAVALTERIGGRFATALDVSRELALPTLARVPELPSGTQTAPGPLKSALIESFFQLVMAIRYSTDEPIRTLAITSPSPGDGKSSIALNLALTLAEIEPRVLLIDGDMRLPSLNRKLGRRNDVGLSDLLVGRASLSTTIQGTVHPSLDILTAGTKPPNPLTLLQSKRFAALLQDLSKVYRVIVVDAPALEAVLDPAMIAAVCDGTVLVVASNQTGYHGAKAALARLRASGAKKILGVVINRSRVRPRRSAYYGDAVSSPIYLGGEGVAMLPRPP
jgi:succinoglycan biosynthesis transport protein ExoP